MATIAELIERSRERLISRFTQEAGRLESAQGLSSYELIDNVPEYLDTLVEFARGNSPETAQKKQRLEQTHIGLRLRLGYNQEDVTAEYVLLGRLVSELWESLPTPRQPSPEDKQHLFTGLQQALERTVTLFTGRPPGEWQAERQALRQLDSLALGPPRGRFSSLSGDRRLAPLLEVVRQAMRVDAALLLLLGEDGCTLLPAAATGLWSEQPWERRVALDSDTFIARVAAAEEPVYLADLADTGVRLDGEQGPVGVHSLLGMRMWPFGRLLGVVCVGLAHTRAFEPHARRNFELLVEHLSGLLENMLLRQRLEAPRAPAEPHTLTEDRLRLTLDATGMGTWDYDPRTDEAHWDERTLALFGLPPDAPVDMERFLARVHPEDRERTRAATQQALNPQGPGTYRIEFRTVEQPGEGVRWLESTGRAFFDAQGQPVRFMGTVVDITPQVREREATARERHRVATVLESISDAFITVDTQWRFTFLNREAERLLGQPREQLLGRSHWDVYPATLGTALEHNCRRAAAERVSLTFENHYAPWDRWFELRVYPSEEGLAVYFHDITAKKQGEAEREALLREQVRLRELAERALRERAVEVLERGDALIVMDSHFRILLVNENQERLSRTRREDTLGRDFWERYPASAAPESRYWREYHRVVEQRVPVQFDEYYAPLDLWTSVSAYPTSEGAWPSSSATPPRPSAPSRCASGCWASSAMTCATP